MVPPTPSYTDYDYTIIKVRSELLNAGSLNIFEFISEKMASNCEFIWVSHWFISDIHFYFHQ